MSTNRGTWIATSALLLGLAAAGCGEDKKVPAAEPAASAEAPGRNQAALGGKLAAAVQAAESAQPVREKSQDGPPDKGIFAPGAADKVLALGATPKIDLLGEGSDPKVTLAYALPETEQKATVSVAFRQQGRGLPVEWSLALKTEKAKDDKKADAEGTRVVATITGLSLPPQVPKDAGDALGKAKGSSLRWLLSPTGAVSDASLSIAKGADAGMDQFLRQVLDGIGTALPPLPSKPVGAGAYWMVTDRPTGGLVDVIRYRVYRVEKVEKNKATLSVDIRQYAAKGEIDAGEGQKLALDQFESTGKGRVEWNAEAILPPRAEAQVRLGAAGRVGGSQQAMLQAETTVKVSATGADKSDKKK